jgi:GTP-binding protein
MNVRHVTFLKSAGGEGAFPAHELPEVAFAGRSNCGKSSLVNTLVGRRNLARVSRTPGRTQLVNFFRVDDRVVLVDLPGYGFAQVPLAVRAAWGPMVERYLRERQALRALVLLLDVRRTPGEEEHRLVDWCAARGLPVVHVATKVDKLPPSRRTLALRAHAAAFGVRPSAVLPFSALSRDGRDALWARLLALAPAPGATPEGTPDGAPGPAPDGAPGPDDGDAGEP